MQSRIFSPALREPVFFLWESYGRPKVGAARYVSIAVKGRGFGNREITYDHCIPFNVLRDRLLDVAEPTGQAIRPILEKNVSALITIEEDKRLREVGLGSKMRSDWDWETGDPLARYSAAGIQVERNGRYREF